MLPLDEQMQTMIEPRLVESCHSGILDQRQGHRDSGQPRVTHHGQYYEEVIPSRQVVDEKSGVEPQEGANPREHLCRRRQYGTEARECLIRTTIKEIVSPKMVDRLFMKGTSSLESNGGLGDIS